MFYNYRYYTSPPPLAALPGVDSKCGDLGMKIIQTRGLMYRQKREVDFQSEKFA